MAWPCRATFGYNGGMDLPGEDAVGYFTTPPKLWSREEVLTTPCPVPSTGGVYGWYFRDLPEIVPVAGCTRVGDSVLAYVGISPKAPPRNGRPASSQTLRSRIRYHFMGNAEGSTLRLTLGCLLSGTLGIALRRVGGGERYRFGPGEDAISAWMDANASVCWLATPEPWVVEAALIAVMDLPLNLDQNRGHQFAASLSALRRSIRAKARTLPVMSDW